MMNRRGFFGSMAGFAASLALDPERALWVPGKKLISIPNRSRFDVLPVDLCGLKYYQVVLPFTRGTWMGLNRDWWPTSGPISAKSVRVPFTLHA